MNAGTFLYLLQGDHDFSDELFRVGREAVVDDCNLARKSGGGVAFLADELHQATVLRGRLGVVSAEAHACAERSGQINDVARKAVGFVKHEEFAVVLPEAALVQVLLRYAEADLAEEDQRFGLIFSAFAASSTPIADTSLPVVTMSWQYVAQTIFNMLILVALIKGAERIAKEMFGL